MKMGKKNQIQKKCIIALIFLLLFQICYPLRVKATMDLIEDLEALPARIIFALEKGILKFANDIFTDEEWNSHTRVTVISDDTGVYTYENMIIKLTPEAIIKGQFLIFNADIFKDVESDEVYFDANKENVITGRKSLRETIAGWYYSLRNFAIVALLSVLVYVGIRMIISTLAPDKAKYKNMFMDWLVALCLVIVMHYMMIGILNISTMITKAFGRSR